MNDELLIEKTAEWLESKFLKLGFFFSYKENAKYFLTLFYDLLEQEGYCIVKEKYLDDLENEVNSLKDELKSE